MHQLARLGVPNPDECASDRGGGNELTIRSDRQSSESSSVSQEDGGGGVRRLSRRVNRGGRSLVGVKARKLDDLDLSELSAWEDEKSAGGMGGERNETFWIVTCIPLAFLLHSSVMTRAKVEENDTIEQDDHQFIAPGCETEDG